MKPIVIVCLLICVLALGVHSQFTDKDFEEIESEHFNRPSPSPSSKKTTTTRRPMATSPKIGTTTRRPRPTKHTPSTSTTTLRPTNPGIDGNGQLIGCACRSTQETNLVCGTDGNTYGNPAKLKCAQRCGHVVKMNFLGSCRGRS